MKKLGPKTRLGILVGAGMALLIVLTLMTVQLMQHVYLSAVPLTGWAPLEPQALTAVHYEPKLKERLQSYLARRPLEGEQIPELCEKIHAALLRDANTIRAREYTGSHRPEHTLILEQGEQTRTLRIYCDTELQLRVYLTEDEQPGEVWLLSDQGAAALLEFLGQLPVQDVAEPGVLSRAQVCDVEQGKPGAATELTEDQFRLLRRSLCAAASVPQRFLWRNPTLYHKNGVKCIDLTFSDGWCVQLQYYESDWGDAVLSVFVGYREELDRYCFDQFHIYRAQNRFDALFSAMEDTP